MSRLLEDCLIKCDLCGGEAYDLIPVGELKICRECQGKNGKKACSE